MGGHRFFTKVTLVDQMWKEVLGDDFITRPRASRIYYRGKFFQYPLEPINALFGLGIFEAIRCGLSYVKAQVFKTRPEDDFQTWVQTALANGSSRSSSRLTPRKSGVCRATRSRPSGPPSGSRIFPCSPWFGTR